MLLFYVIYSILAKVLCDVHRVKLYEINQCADVVDIEHSVRCSERCLLHEQEPGGNILTISVITIQKLIK